MKRLLLLSLTLLTCVAGAQNKAILSLALSSTADNQAILTLSNTVGNANYNPRLNDCDTFQIGSKTGAMDVFVVLADGTDSLALALTDLGSTTPSTTVTVTTATGNYGLRGHFNHIVIRQNGATAVTYGYFICSQM